MTARTALDRPAWLLAVGLALLAGLLAVTLGLAAGQRRDEAAVIHSMDAQNRLLAVLSSLQDAETGQRGYIITGQSEFLEPYERARAGLVADLDRLAATTTDNPIQRAAMVQLRTLGSARLAMLRDGIIQRRFGNFRRAAAIVSKGDSKRLMDAFRRQVSVMSVEEGRLLTIRQARSRATFGRLRVFIVLGFATVVVLAVLAMRAAAYRLSLVAASRNELARANAGLVAEGARREEVEAQIRQMQKMEAVGQLTGGIAHDFNNMLSVIVAGLNLARRQLRTAPDKAEVWIDRATEGAHKAAALTTRLLAFSRQQTLAPVASDTNKLIADMSELVRRTIGENLSVEIVLAAGVWRIHADVSQLENAILNLCVNARDAMPDGGKLTIETSNAHLDDAYARRHVEVSAGQYVLISASDSGVGMSADVIERAFDPFFTTKAVGKGTGLGLSQVFGFVKQSGGHVAIYSEPGVGTSIKLYLPRWTGAEAALAQPAPQIVLPGGADNEIILVVEDDADVRRVSVEALEHLGYTVLEASSGEQALEVLALAARVDLMFTDIIMPGMTGRVLAATVTADRPELKVLYTTGYARDAVVHNGILGADLAFLPKPFTVDQLALKVREVLGLADTRGVRNRPTHPDGS
jgi:signal transduction histidine kinase/ActR/RegA family two-component response regulator